MDAEQKDKPLLQGLGKNLNRLLLEFGHDYERRVMAELHRHGHSLVRPSHVTVFSNLGLGAVRVTELAEKAHVTQQAMGKMLKELERIGYIVRDIDGSDRRAKKIRPTERGVDLMHSIVEVTEDIRQFYATQVGEDALKDLEQRLNFCMRELATGARVQNWQKSNRVA
jgi:DNA-binding MarR family transcriptional regulator